MESNESSLSHNSWPTKVMPGTSVVVYALSMVLPAFPFMGENAKGYQAVILGALMPIIDRIDPISRLIFFAGWLANPFYIGALICFLSRRFRAACLLSYAAILINVPFWVQSQFFAGTPLQVAFYVWIFAFILLGTGGLLCHSLRDKNFDQLHAFEVVTDDDSKE